jgi:pimeloyl-ACP methyl ester carboxylesterase
MRKVGGRLLLRGVPADYVDRFFAEYRRCESFQPMFDLLDVDWFTGLEPVDLPGVLLWGDRDRVLTSGQAEAFERLLPSARTAIEPGWGHFPMIDDPDDYALRIATIARELVDDG